MKVLFIARHFTYFRNFESVIAAMADRGHAIHLAADRSAPDGGRAAMPGVHGTPHRDVSGGVEAARDQFGPEQRARPLLRVDDPHHVPA